MAACTTQWESRGGKNYGKMWTISQVNVSEETAENKGKSKKNTNTKKCLGVLPLLSATDV